MTAATHCTLLRPEAEHREGEPAGHTAATRPALMTTLATIGLGLNFWAWALLGPIRPDLGQRFGIGVQGQLLLVAGPVIVGSVGRIPVGVLTDRHGARVMFPVVSLAAAVPVAVFAFVDSLPALVATGCALGISGTAFAVGGPLVSRAYPPGRRGAALGIFGAGMGGAALAGVSSPWLYQPDSRRTLALVLAAVLAGYAVAASLLIRDGGTEQFGRTAMRGLAAVLSLRVIRRLAALYALAFGLLVAFALYLPVYLQTVYRVGWPEAVLRTAVVLGVAAAARPLGGWLADRHTPARVLVSCFAGAGASAFVLAFEPPGSAIATVLLAIVGAFLGACSGALLAFGGTAAPPGQLGAALGAIGAAGGLGAVVSSVLLGGVRTVAAGYPIAVMALSVATLGAASYVYDVRQWFASALDAGVAADTAPVGGTLIVALRASDTRRDLPAVLRALADLAKQEELVVVFGTARRPAGGLGAHELIAGLRSCLPRHVVVGLIVDAMAVRESERALLNELLADGATPVAVTATGDPRALGLLLAGPVGADRVVRLVPDATGGATLRPLWTSAV